MPTLISHAVAGACAGLSFADKVHQKKILFWGIFCTILPDLDVISFKLDISYAHVLGHRGFSHSFLFAILLGFVVTTLFLRGEKRLWTWNTLLYWFYFFLLTASHGLLDMFTNGGLGVGLFTPFMPQRYFFSETPIQVASIGVRSFFTAKGFAVLKSEMVWVWIPCIFLLVLMRLGRKVRTLF